MFTLVRCPACGGDWAESDVRCPACGFEDAAEDVVASWVSDPVVETAGPTGDEAVCLACGYEGPLIQAPSEIGPCARPAALPGKMPAASSGRSPAPIAAR